ncbi:YjaG family protein [Ferrimonas gelatinilytica]|uniref:YjaG family protein n=1 Tax=Ferrimonas gelatinilytica TaxID=1255257 RepID=A0ABP9S7L0_9GAMM
MTAKPGFFNRIKALNSKQLTLFAIALSERMLPNYLLFAQITEQADSQKAATIQDMLWQSLYTRNFKLNYERMQDQLELLIPEPEEYDFYGVYPATDALVAMVTILSAMEQKVDTDLINLSKLSSSTVAAFIEASEQPEVESEEALDDFVFSHPLMAQEREIQNQLLEWVEEQDPIDPEAVKALRKELRDEGVSNIGVTLTDEA